MPQLQSSALGTTFPHLNEPSKGLYLRNLSSPPPSCLDLLRHMALLVPNLVLLAVGRCFFCALAVLQAVLPITLVLGAVGPGVGALAILEAVLPLTLILGAVGIGHRALAFREAGLPLTLVLVAVDQGHGALAVSEVLLPITFVLVAAGIGHVAFSVHLALLPITPVRRAVLPGHAAQALFAISVAEVARASDSILFNQFLAPAGLQRRAISAPHRH